MAFSLFAGGTCSAAEPPGNLRAYFFYGNAAVDKPFDSICKSEPALEGTGVVAVVAAEVAASIAGKAVGALFDILAVKAKPEATVLDTTIPVPGLYSYDKGTKTLNAAITGGCLVIHNSKTAEPADGSLFAAFRLIPSHDGNYFRFNVLEWKFEKFINQDAGGVFSKADKRDFAINIEFLTPGAQGLGNRSVYFERIVSGKTQSELSSLFVKNQQLPWLALPARPTPPTGDNVPDYISPFNLSISVVETSIPNVLTVWLSDYAAANKDRFSNMASNSVKEILDPDFAAAEKAKASAAADTAYGAYKTAWDAALAQLEKKPAAPQNPVGNDTIKHEADLAYWKSSLIALCRVVGEKKDIAKKAYSEAGLPWNTELPEIPSP